MSGPTPCLRRYREEDAAAALSLIVSVFTGKDPNQAGLTASWFRQKYDQNPAGFDALVAETVEGRLMGFMAVLRNRMSIDGTEHVFAQACDTCTDPTVRSGLRHPSVFVRLCQALVSSVAQPPRGYTVMYGLPIPEAYVIGSRYIDYWMLRTQPVLVSSDARRMPPMLASVQVDHADGFTPERDVHWRSFARQHRCVGRRDQAFLNWRFRDHPGSPYSVGIARTLDVGDFRGYAVYRSGEFLGRRLGILMDFMVPEDDHEAAGNLVHWAGWKAATEGLSELAFLCPPTSYWFRRFQDHGFRVQPTPYVMIGRPFDPAIEPAFLRDHWYYTMADLDVL